MQKKVKWIIVFVIIAIIIILIGVALLIQKVTKDYVEGEIIVGFEEEITDEQARSTIEYINSTEEGDVYVKETIGPVSEPPVAYLIKVPVGQEQRFIDIFKACESVKYAELNKIGTIA